MRILFAFAGLVLVALVAPVSLAPAAHATDITRVTSPGGIEAWLVSDPQLPIISLQFAFIGGMALERPDEAGLASFTASLMDQGAGARDADAFAKALEDNSIGLGFSAGRDSFGGLLTTLSDASGLEGREALAFSLLKDALADPRFDDEAVERIRRAKITSIRRAQGSPRWKASRTFNAISFPGHPYGRPGSGTEDTVSAIDVADMRSFLDRVMARDRLHIAVAGDIKAAELGPLLDELFGHLPETTDIAATPDIAVAGAGKTVLVEDPSPQTVFVLGLPGITRDDPDWYAATVMNYILGGGGFNSRLMQEVREKRGLTYGVRSSLEALDHAGRLRISGSTQNATAAEALDVIRAELVRMAEEGISADELAGAKTYLTGALPLSMTSTGSIASILLGVKQDGLGIDYLDRRAELINGVTAQDVARVATRLLRPDALSTVLVGAPEGIEPTRTFDEAPFSTDPASQ